MSPEERVAAIGTFGFSKRQSRFLDIVMSHAGVCLLRQYTAFAGIAHGQKTRAFFSNLVRRGYASSHSVATIADAFTTSITTRSTARSGSPIVAIGDRFQPVARLNV